MRTIENPSHPAREREFVGLVAHELRNLSTVVLGHLEAVLDDPDLAAAHHHSLGVVQRDVHRLLRLTGDLPTSPQVQAGRFELDATELDLGQLVQHARDNAGPAADDGGLRLTSSLPALPLLVRADAGRLAQVCDNLLANAMAHTPPGGAVHVSLEGWPAEAVLRVSDTGVGVPAAELARLGTPFARASTTSVRHPGTGLGLAVTDALVTAHGGSWTIQSELGVGTTVTVRLPALVQAG